jgi:predicted transcriptional regulator
MKILEYSEIEKINSVVEYILTRHCVEISKLKRRFGITTKEYEMIAGLAMPALRNYNEACYWKKEYSALKNAIERTLNNPKLTGNFKSVIKEIVEESAAQVAEREVATHR